MRLPLGLARFGLVTLMTLAACRSEDAGVLRAAPPTAPAGVVLDYVKSDAAPWNGDHLTVYDDGRIAVWSRGKVLVEAGVQGSARLDHVLSLARTCSSLSLTRENGG